MSKRKLRIHKTDPEVVVSNLRGEIGEIIVTWTLLHAFKLEVQKHQTEDVAADLANPELTILVTISDKLADEIVARLAELAEPHTKRLTFRLAATKLGSFAKDTSDYARFIKNNRFKEKRNRDISHKEAPQTWDDHRYLHIDYRLIVVAVAKALRLMKRIDRQFLGPSAPLLWQKLRAKRYKPTSPPRVGYMLLPHMNLSSEERQFVIAEEAKEGRVKWEPMKTVINGKETVVPVCRHWAGVLLGDRLLVLDKYPLNELTSIDIERSAIDAAAEDSVG